jgi:hypothetical protein
MVYVSQVPDSARKGSTPTLFVMVGLPASGKSTRAKQIEEGRGALRLIPDEWMIPLFGESALALPREPPNDSRRVDRPSPVRQPKLGLN